MEEEGEIVRGLGKSLPLKDACAARNTKLFTVSGAAAESSAITSVPRVVSIATL